MESSSQETDVSLMNGSTKLSLPGITAAWA